MAANRRIWMMIAGVALALLLAGCGDDDGDVDTGDAAPSDDAGDSGDDADAGDDAGDSGDDADAGDDGASGGDGAAGGTLVIGEETIALDSARCFLEEQDAAAGGGKILFVGQGFGTNAAGDGVTLDVTRFDEDSQFTGDDILVDIGDFETGTSLAARTDLGTVQLDGRTMSADGLTFVDSDDFSEQPGSFVLNC